MQVSSPEVAAALVGGLFGLIAGSFANVVIYRLPLEQSVVFPASRCPRCQTAIKPWQNIPVFSWIFLRGRCASCHAPISFRYPLVEAVHGLGFAAVILVFGVTPFTPCLLLFFFALVVLAFIDWDHQILPDRITLPMIVIGVASSLLSGALVSSKESVLAAFFGYLSFYLVAEGYTRVRGLEGLGMGDWKLSAMMGAFLGGQRLLLTVFLASLSGMVYGLIQATRLRNRGESPDAPPNAPSPLTEEPAGGLSVLSANEPWEAADSTEPRPAEALEPEPIGKYKLPFGTFLAIAALLVLFCGDTVLRWYASLFAF